MVLNIRITNKKVTIPLSTLLSKYDPHITRILISCPSIVDDSLMYLTADIIIQNYPNTADARWHEVRHVNDWSDSEICDIWTQNHRSIKLTLILWFAVLLILPFKLTSINVVTACVEYPFCFISLHYYTSFRITVRCYICWQTPQTLQRLQVSCVSHCVLNFIWQPRVQMTWRWRHLCKAIKSLFAQLCAFFFV